MVHCYLKLCINTYNSFHYAVHLFLGGVMVRSIYFKLEIPAKEKVGGCEIHEMLWPRNVTNP
jgi:hypothetical protein